MKATDFENLCQSVREGGEILRRMTSCPGCGGDPAIAYALNAENSKWDRPIESYHLCPTRAAGPEYDYEPCLCCELCMRSGFICNGRKL